MARKPETDIESAVIQSAMTLFAERGYRAVRLADIALHAGCDLGDLRRRFDDKSAILGRFLIGIDAAVLGDDPDFGEDESVRDRLFDLLMRRFDALQPHRDALASVRRDLRDDLPAILSLAPQGLRALGWYLEAAGESADGLAGAIRIKGLAAVWLNCLNVWFRDDSEDLSKTMAELDKSLARAERAANWFAGLPGPRRPSGGAPEDAAAAGDADSPADGAENGPENGARA